MHWAPQVALVVKNMPAVCGRPGLGRSPGVGHGNPLQYLAWIIPMDREAWQATVHRVAQSRT